MPPSRFIGRSSQLAVLRGHLDAMRAGGATGPSRIVVVRGRPQVGKSRLVEQSLAQSGASAIWLDGSSGSRAVGEALAAAARPADAPLVVVIDRLEALLEPVAEAGEAIAAFERLLHEPGVLLIGIGADVSVVEQLAEGFGGAPFEVAVVVVEPFDPAELARLLDLSPADAFEARLVSGGLPLVVRDWRVGATVSQFLAESLSDPTSAVIVTGERIHRAMLAGEQRAASVFEVIADGERSFSGIASRLGDHGAPLAPASVNNALTLLNDRRIIVSDQPYSNRPTPKERRHRVADSYFAFWSKFVRPSLAQIERGRSDLALARIDRDWYTWREAAMVPLVRQALGQMLPDERFADARHAGGWWNRSNNPVVDLVAGDAPESPAELSFIGAVRWDDQPFGNADRAALARVAAQVPGSRNDTPLVAVSRSSGSPTDGLAVVWGPDELLRVWR